MSERPIDNIRRLLFPKEESRRDKGLCPFCGKEVNVDEFRDTISRREFGLSGLCQNCQDETFGEAEAIEDGAL